MMLHVNHVQPGQANRAVRVVAALLALVEQGRMDVRLLPNLRVHLDWIQYRPNFRESVTARRAADVAGAPIVLAEVAVHLRRSEPAGLAADLHRALRSIDPESPVEGPGLARRVAAGAGQLDLGRQFVDQLLPRPTADPRADRGMDLLDETTLTRICVEPSVWGLR